MKNIYKYIGIATLVVIISLFAACSGKKSSTSESPPDITPVLISQDWDKIIAEYEEFVTNYADEVRKAVTGGNPVIDELEALENILGYWIEQLNNIGDQLTPEQEERIEDITHKLFTAVMNL